MALSTRNLGHRSFIKEFNSLRCCDFFVELIVTSNAALVVWSKFVQGTFLSSKINIYQHRNSLHHLRFICFVSGSKNLVLDDDFISEMLKWAKSRFAHFEKFSLKLLCASFNRPCSFMVYYNLFGASCPQVFAPPFFSRGFLWRHKGRTKRKSHVDLFSCPVISWLRLIQVASNLGT